MSQDWAATTVIGNRGAGRGSTKSASAINSARRRGEVFALLYLLPIFWKRKTVHFSCHMYRYPFWYSQVSIKRAS